MIIDLEICCILRSIIFNLYYFLQLTVFELIFIEFFFKQCRDESMNKMRLPIYKHKNVIYVNRYYSLHTTLERYPFSFLRYSPPGYHFPCSFFDFSFPWPNDEPLFSSCICKQTAHLILNFVTSPAPHSVVSFTSYILLNIFLFYLGNKSSCCYGLVCVTLMDWSSQVDIVL